MIHKPYRFRDMDDDYAPVDYTYVSSVSEGKRIRQQEKIHKEPQQMAVRHRADPFEQSAPADGAVVMPERRRTARPHGMQPASPIPGGVPPVRRGSEPRASAIPENPFEEDSFLPEEEPAQEPVLVAEDGSQYTAPALPQMPEWLRVAQQNRLPGDDRRPPTPRVQRAPRQEEPEVEKDLLGRPVRRKEAAPREQRVIESHAALYENAGYPPELLKEQQALEEEQDRIARRRRHGAQHAVEQRRQEEYQRSVGAAPANASYPPPREEYARRRALTQEERAARAAAVERSLQRTETPSRGAAYASAASEERSAYRKPNRPYGREDYEAGAPYEQEAGYAGRGHGAYEAESPYEREPGYAGRSHGVYEAESPYEREPGYAGRSHGVYEAGAPYERESGYAERSHGVYEAGAPYERESGYAERNQRAYRAEAPYEQTDPYADPKRHGKRQSAAGYRPDGYSPNAYTVQNAPEDVPEEEAGHRFSIPWLGIAVFVAALAAIGLWIAQMTFANQTEDVLAQRRIAVATLKDNHPYQYRELIEREAAKNNLNPAFVAAIVFNESSFRTDAESNVGARGLMQVMSDTADSINKDLNIDNYSFDKLYEAETNVIFGCYYLGQLSQRFRGDPILVSAAYHAGPTQVQNWLNTSTYSVDGLTLILDNMTDGPTKQYATRVTRDYAIYKRLYYETTEDDL